MTGSVDAIAAILRRAAPTPIDRDYWIGTAGGDVIDGFGWYDTIYGRNGDDTLRGGSNADFFDDDLIFGNRGDDVIIGDAGDNTLVGGPGDDILLSNGAMPGGDDLMLGGRGDDILTDQGGGDQRMIGGRGDDTIRGGGGSDTLRGGPGDDVVTSQSAGGHGGGGDDLMTIGWDAAYGDAGNDTLRCVGEFLDATLAGGRGDDLLVSRKDRFEADLYGGSGDDTLELGPGLAAGGAGRDLVALRPGSVGETMLLYELRVAESTLAVADTVEGFGAATRFILAGARLAFAGAIAADPARGADLPGASDGLAQIVFAAAGEDTAVIVDRDDDGALDATDLYVVLTGAHALTDDQFRDRDIRPFGGLPDDFG